jgi:hypothetical protein
MCFKKAAETREISNSSNEMLDTLICQRTMELSLLDTVLQLKLISNLATIHSHVEIIYVTFSSIYKCNPARYHDSRSQQLI